jgi:hypothetical protein
MECFNDAVSVSVVKGQSWHIQAEEIDEQIVGLADNPVLCLS